MTDFTVLFYSFLVLCGGITFRSSDYYKRISARNRNDEDREGLSKEVVTAHNSLLKKYLFVYLLAVASDWLQGPYVYALYSDYGFTQHEIAQLFVAGFGSSMIFGSFVGSVAGSYLITLSMDVFILMLRAHSNQRLDILF